MGRSCEGKKKSNEGELKNAELFSWVEGEKIDLSGLQIANKRRKIEGGV